MAIHCQLLFTTILYSVVFICSIVEISTIAFAKASLDGTCYLYVKIKYYAIIDTPSSLPCNLNIYALGACLIYSVVMAVYHGYGTIVASRDSHIGRTMWVMPWLLLNTFVTVLMFVCACVYTIGFYLTCSNANNLSPLQSCKEILMRVSSSGTHFKGSTYQCMTIAEGASWVNVALWSALVAMEIIRLFRNKRARAGEVYEDTGTSDDVKIADLPPSA